MNRGFAAEFRRVVIFTLLSISFGLINGFLPWTLVAGGSLYMGWMMWQIHRLDDWLHHSRSQDPPDASGIWGDIFDNIVRLQKRQQREKTRLQAVIRRGQETTEALPDGIVLLDSKGNIDWFNPVAKQLLHLRSQDHGQALVNYVRHPEFIDYMECGDYGEPLDLSAPQSQALRLQYQINRFGQGGQLVMIRDVTRLHKLEQMRRDFVANVSHELRTPLTVIRGYVETLQMSPELSAVGQKALRQMEQQGQRMTDLIDDLIVLSQMETDGRDSSQTAVMLLPLLEQVKSDGQAFSAEKNHVISINCAADLALYGCAKELHSAFSNLVFNGVKYSLAGNRIDIQVRQSSQGINVMVTDEGEGIDPVHFPRLTERFYRVDSSRQSGTGGTGLGLAIVKHVLLHHGAHLAIESQPGKGSCFTCVFPIQRMVKTLD